MITQLKFLAVTIFVLILGCDSHVTHKDPTLVSQDVKLRGEGDGMSIDDYLAESTEDRKLMWKERLLDSKSIFDQSIDNLIDELVDSLSIQGTGVFDMTDRIAEIGIELAESMSEETFINVFASLDELLSSPISGSGCDYCIDDLEDWVTGYDAVAESNNLPKCNCRWTCGQPGTVCTHEECEATRRGCGFMWLGSCKKRDEIFIDNCP